MHQIFKIYFVMKLYMFRASDDGNTRCPKHVEFYDKTNFGYLLQLVDCFIRTYHVARSLEHKVYLEWCEF
jgi:hypothetical protein